MRWVTRKGVRLDRCACAWLIVRHLDPEAKIDFIEADEMPAAIEQGALPFHNTTSEGTHSQERVSFQQLLAEYPSAHLDSALELMGQLIRMAETEKPGSKRQGAGLMAVAEGMQDLCDSDNEMVERMLPIFDAFYSYCQRRVRGQRDWANT